MMRSIVLGLLGVASPLVLSQVGWLERMHRCNQSERILAYFASDLLPECLAMAISTCRQLDALLQAIKKRAYPTSDVSSEEGDYLDRPPE